MKFVCDRVQLSEGLQAVVGVVDPCHIKPMLRYVKIVAGVDGITLAATDLEIGIRHLITGVEVAEPGEIVLPAARVAAIVRELGDEVIRFTATETACTIEGSGSRFRVLGDRTDGFPAIPSFPEGDAVEVGGSVLKAMIQNTAFAAAPDKMRYALNGLLFVTREGSARLDIVATDGRRMAWVTQKVESKQSASAEVVVPTKGALQIAKMAGDSDAVRLRFDERCVYAKTATTELAAQLVDGQFPNFRAVIPKDVDKKFEVPASELSAAVKRAALLSKSNARSVAFEVVAGKLVLSSSAPEAGEAKVEVDIAYDGEAVRLALNPDFVIDGLKPIGGSPVSVEMKDGATAFVLRGEGYVYMTMPITD